MSTVTTTELMDIAERMAQELRDYADAAVDSGSMEPGTEALLEEFDSLWRQVYGVESAQ